MPARSASLGKTPQKTSAVPSEAAAAQAVKKAAPRRTAAKPQPASAEAGMRFFAGLARRADEIAAALEASIPRAAASESIDGEAVPPQDRQTLLDAACLLAEARLSIEESDWEKADRLCRLIRHAGFRLFSHNDQWANLLYYSWDEIDIRLTAFYVKEAAAMLEDSPQKKALADAQRAWNYLFGADGSLSPTQLLRASGGLYDGLPSIWSPPLILRTEAAALKKSKTLRMARMEKILHDMHAAAVSRMDRLLARACEESVWVAAIALLAYGASVLENRAAKQALDEAEAASLERIRRARAGVETIAERWPAGAKAALPAAIEDCGALLQLRTPEAKEALRTITDSCFNSKGFFSLQKLAKGIGLAQKASLRCWDSDMYFFADLLPKNLKSRGRQSGSVDDDPWDFGGGIFEGEEWWRVRDAIRAENSFERFMRERRIERRDFERLQSLLRYAWIAADWFGRESDMLRPAIQASLIFEQVFQVRQRPWTDEEAEIVRDALTKAFSFMHQAGIQPSDEREFEDEDDWAR